MATNWWMQTLMCLRRKLPFWAYKQSPVTWCATVDAFFDIDQLEEVLFTNEGSKSRLIMRLWMYLIRSLFSRNNRLYEFNRNFKKLCTAIVSKYYTTKLRMFQLLSNLVKTWVSCVSFNCPINSYSSYTFRMNFSLS